MIMGITGLISSGKDTAADYLCTVHGFKRMSFAGTLKDAISVVFGWDRELLEGTTSLSRVWREQVDEWWADRLGIPDLTPRYILQQWGTEVGRKGFHTDIWVASVENQLRRRLLIDDIVITDCRFPNELAAIKNAGGVTIRIQRGPDPEWYPYAELYNRAESIAQREMYLEKLVDVHESEYSSVGLPHDFLVTNNKTITELHRQLEAIVLNGQS